jgi:twinfilin-like protein
LQLNFSDPNVTPSDLASRIPSDKPSYTFYHYPSTSSVIFVYTCPPSSKVKERMVYSTSKRSVLEVARVEGVDVAKKIEVGGPEEVTADMLREEAQPRVEGAAAGKQGFARPKRPGKR